MADWSLPTITSLYTAILDLLKARDVDAITLCNSVPTNPTTNTIQYNRAGNKFQEYNGATWDDKVVAVAGGGTGAANASGARTNLGVGTLGTQESNNVNITGGAITGATLNASDLSSGTAPVARGGTGITSYTTGDILVADGATSLKKLALGSANKYLKVNTAGNDLEYATLSAGHFFKGVNLRTGEAGDSATTIKLLSAEEIVCSDGSLRNPASNLSAIITTSGIGGLRASQSEAASTWYKIMYAFGGSGEGLYLEQAKDYYPDQTYETSDTADGPTSATTRSAQSFQLATAGKIEFLDLLLYQAGTPASSFYVTLEEDDSNKPSGTPLATSNYLLQSGLSAATTGLWTRLVFRTPATLSASTRYWIVLRQTSTGTTDWRLNAAGGYSGGNAATYDGSTWTAQTWDNCFRIYVTRNDNAVALPAGYDTGYSHIGWVYNDSGSNFIPFTARDKIVRQRGLAAANETLINTNGRIILTDLSTALPPTPASLRVNVESPASGPSWVSPVPDGYVYPFSGSYMYSSAWGEFTGTTGHRSAAPLSCATEYQAAYVGGYSGAILYRVGFDW